jgi:hypothetical protein
MKGTLKSATQQTMPFILLLATLSFIPHFARYSFSDNFATNLKSNIKNLKSIKIWHTM